MKYNYCGCHKYDIISIYTSFEKNNVLKCKKCGLVYLEIKKDKIRFETVERYNSLRQLRNILCYQQNKENITEIMKKHIFPWNKKDEVRLPNINDNIENEFNRIFEKAVNSELMGNCLRWIGRK